MRNRSRADKWFTTIWVSFIVFSILILGVKFFGYPKTIPLYWFFISFVCVASVAICTSIAVTLYNWAAENQKFRPWLLLPMILIGVHTGLVMTAMGTNMIGRDFIHGYAWVLFGIIDFPSSWLLWKTKIEPWIFFLMLGIIHWGLVGILLRAGWKLLCRLTAMPVVHKNEV